MSTELHIGQKIRQLRIRNNLTQEELANRCELSKGFISQLESDQTSPSITTLVDILEGLGTDISKFFSEEINEQIVFTKDDVFVKEDPQLYHAINWIIPNSQKNKMEPILLELYPGGQSNIETPHEGEEFGYVVTGRIVLMIGDCSYKAKKGDSFYFKPAADHYIKNAGTSTAKIIWVSSPPYF
jgi:transcriptional regulator with XRE-family HTH domain